jgi:hypothetical protein
MNKIALVKKFVSDHKVVIAVVATATVSVALDRVRVVQMHNFLKEHNLLDEFYSAD